MISSKIIERYLNAVTERLPEDTREDVKRELQANIEDMLPENPTEEDVRIVLEKLGNPVKLANEYRQTKRYLIGPSLYDSYFPILKLVAGIAAIIFAFLALLGSLQKPIEGNVEVYVKLITEILSGAIEGAIQAFLWVTVVFAVLERAGLGEGNLPFGKKKWSVEDLSQVPVSPKGKISRIETTVGLVLTILFTSILVFRPQYIGWYVKGDTGFVLSESLFNIERLNDYIFVILLLAILQFFISIYKFIIMQWNLPLAIANTINNIALSIIIFIMMSDLSIINVNFVTHFAEAVNRPVAEVIKGFGSFFTVFIIFFIIMCAIDSISGFVKSRRLNLPAIKLT